MQITLHNTLEMILRIICALFESANDTGKQDLMATA